MGEYYDRKKLFISIACGIKIAQIRERVFSKNVFFSNRSILIRVESFVFCRTPRAVFSTEFAATRWVPTQTKKPTNLWRVCSENSEKRSKSPSATWMVSDILCNWRIAVVALAGSGPAIIYMLIEALADGGVKSGLPRDLAMNLAAYTARGAAEMVIQTNRHPGREEGR